MIFILKLKRRDRFQQTKLEKTRNKCPIKIKTTQQKNKINGFQNDITPKFILHPTNSFQNEKNIFVKKLFANKSIREIGERKLLCIMW